MIDEFTVYDVRNGAVIRTGSCPKGQGGNQAIEEWERFASGIWPHNEFWRDGDTFKPRAPLELSIDGTTISGLPTGSVLRCDDAVYGPIDDGTAEFDFQLPGKYVVRIDCVSHKAGSVTLTKE